MIRRLTLVAATLATMVSLGCSHHSRGENAGSGTLTAPDAVRSRMERTFQYQLAEQAKKKPDAGWIRAAFYTGVMAAYRTTHEAEYLNSAMDWARNQGHWAPAKGDWRFADNYCNAQVYCELYELKHDREMIAASRANFDRIIAEPKPGRVDWWWCDALYMGPPAFVRMSAVTGDRKYANVSDRMYWDATDFLYRPQYQLFFRDKNYFNKKTANGQPVFWSRGNGWVHAGLARILQYLPKDHPSRGKYVQLFKDMSAKLITLQGEDGLWRPSLLDAAEFPEPETSGTAFFTFGMAWGINNGLLDRETYLPHVLKGYAGLCELINSQGRLTHVQQVAGAPGKVAPYGTHEYAVGAFLQASCEVLKLKVTAEEEMQALRNYVGPGKPPEGDPATRPAH